MEIIISTVNFRKSSKLEAFIKEKVGKLFRQCNEIIRAIVVLRETESRNPKNKSCEIRVMIPGNDHFARKCAVGYEQSILNAVEVLRKSIRRRKDRGIAKRYSM